MNSSLIERVGPEGVDVFLATAAVRVLYEDAELLAVDKPAGMVVHPAYRHPEGTLADLVFARQAASGESRPWLLHRLDRETSGVVLFAKTESARRALVRQFERRSVQKLYLALASHELPTTCGFVDLPLARDEADRRRVVVHTSGQTAVTRFATIEVRHGLALLLVRPVTGRTHQIRAHLAHLGAALVGDQTYVASEDSREVGAARSLLHAWRIEVLHPGDGAPLVVTAPLAPDFADVLVRLGFAELTEDRCRAAACLL